jgi:hypothetical protein
MMGVVRIVVVGKAKTVVGIEPAHFGVKPLTTPANIDLTLAMMVSRSFTCQ